MTELRTHRTMKGTRWKVGRYIQEHQREARRGIEHMAHSGYIKPLAEWDLEELSRGKPRNRGGGFNGQPPKWLKGAVEEEIQRRFKQKAIRELIVYFPKALQTLVELLDVDEPHIRLKACELLLAYTLGKPTVTAHLSADSKAAGMLAAALVMPDGSPAHPVQHEALEGEVVEYE